MNAPGNGAGDRQEGIRYAALAVAVASYVIARAMLVPTVHDECASVLWFVQPGEWLPDRSHGDANNHFLSTGIGVFLYRAFGSGMATLRSGSIVAFALYTWAVWRLGGQLRDRRVRWCFWAGMLLCPFVLDFFSMFRGYGLALAGITLAMDGLLRYAAVPRSGSLFQSLLGCCLGGAAIVALVPVWGIIIAVLVALSMKHWSLLGKGQWALHAASIALFGALPIAYAVNVSLRMQELGLLYHGSLDGFMDVTIASLARYVLGSDAWFVRLTILSVAVFALAIASTVVRRTRVLTGPLVVVTFVLWADVLARIVLARGFGVNYPEDRAGLHFVPLLILAAALAIDALAAMRPAMGWACLPLLFLPARTLWTANLDHCLLWPEQCVPARFMERIAMEERELGRPVLIGAYHQSALTVPFAARTIGSAPPSVQVTDFPEGQHDLRIADGRFIDRARAGYEVLDSAMGPGLWLLRRSRYEDRVGKAGVVVGVWSGADEFHDLALLDTALLRSSQTWVEVRIPLTFAGSSPDVTCVVQVTDNAGNDLRYDALQPCVLRPDWRGDTLSFMRSLPAMPTATRGVVYLYDPKRIDISVGQGSVTTLAPGP
jgi:hypothetical protein